MANKLNKEIDENTLEWARGFKSFLRFDYGDVVYLKSDKKKKWPMVISVIIWDDHNLDYLATWISSQGTKEQADFFDKMLMQ